MPRISELTNDLIEDIARKYPDLESLNLSKNDIRTIPRYLNRLGLCLKSLDVSENEIERVEADFREFPELKELNLSSNSIDGFTNLPPKLECLDLSENSIGIRFEKILRDASCSGTLKYLRLENNPIMDEKDIDVRLCKILPSLQTLNGERVEDIMQRSQTKLVLRETTLSSCSPHDLNRRLERAEAQCKAMAKLLRDQDREICIARADVSTKDGDSVDRTEARVRAFERLLQRWRNQVFAMLVNRNANQMRSRNEMSEMRRKLESERVSRKRSEETLRREREIRIAGDREIALLRTALELRDAARNETRSLREKQNQELLRKMMSKFRSESRGLQLEIERRLANSEKRIHFACNQLRLLESMNSSMENEISTLRSERSRLATRLKRERLEIVRLNEERQSLSRVNTTYITELEEMKVRCNSLSTIEKDRSKLRELLNTERDCAKENESKHKAKIEELKSEIRKLRLERNALLVATREDRPRHHEEEEDVDKNVERFEREEEEDSTSEDENEVPTKTTTTSDRVRYIRRRRSMRGNVDDTKMHMNFRGLRNRPHDPVSRNKNEDEEVSQQKEHVISSSTIYALDELEALSVELLSDD